MTTLVRWQPFREVATLHDELSRLMNGMIETGGRQTRAWVPTLDVWETDDAVVYSFDLPGVKQDDVSVDVEDGALTVTATRERTAEVEEGRYRRLERRHGTFSRTVGLPQGVSEDQIAATYRDGVLEISVPKPEQAKPKRIRIAVEGAEPANGAPPTIDGAASAS